MTSQGSCSWLQDNPLITDMASSSNRGGRKQRKRKRELLADVPNPVPLDDDVPDLVASDDDKPLPEFSASVSTWLQRWGYGYCSSIQVQQEAMAAKQECNARSYNSLMQVCRPMLPQLHTTNCGSCYSYGDVQLHKCMTGMLLGLLALPRMGPPTLKYIASLH